MREKKEEEGPVPAGLARGGRRGFLGWCKIDERCRAKEEDEEELKEQYVGGYF